MYDGSGVCQYHLLDFKNIGIGSFRHRIVNDFCISLPCNTHFMFDSIQIPAHFSFKLPLP